MRFLPTKIHGVLDYLVGILLLSLPWILGFDQQGAQKWVPVILGAGAIIYSLLTRYEWGAVNFFSMKTHLALDFLSGVFLAASPWIFGFAEYVFLPHLIAGIFEIIASLVTRTIPGDGRDGTGSFYAGSNA